MHKEYEQKYENYIISTIEDIKETLLQKNKSYNNSIFEPVRVFSDSSPIDRVKMHLDEKLSRILLGHGYDKEDDYFDLLGYLILYKTLQTIEQEDNSPAEHPAFEFGSTHVRKYKYGVDVSEAIDGLKESMS